MALSTEVNGRTFPVTVSEHGDFIAELDGDQLRAESLKQLTQKIKDEMKSRQQVNVPATLIEVDSYRSRGKDLLIKPVTLTGINTRTRHITWRAADGETGSRYSHHDIYQPLTAEQKNTVSQYHAEMRLATKRWEKFLESLQMQAYAEIEKAAYLGSDTSAETKPKGKGKKK